MSVLKRRSRLVTFRVSDDEYELLANCCLQSGARSVAEYARHSVLQNVTAAIAGPATLSGNLASISRALSELDQSLREARLRIARVLGHVASDESGREGSQAAAAGQHP